MNAPANVQASLASAMAAAFAEIEGATKSAPGQVGQQKYKYADLTSVIDAIKPALVAHGLFFTQCPVPNDKGVQVRTVLHHAGGESLDLGELFVPANKNDAQAYGSALTYCRRYALVTAFGVPVEDDDGNAAARGQERSGPNRVVSPAPISDADYTKIQALCKAVGGNQPAAICTGYKVAKIEDLNATQAAAVIKRLNEKLEEAAKAETNAKATSFGEVLADEIPY